MKSQAFFRRSQSLLRSSAHTHNFFSSTRPSQTQLRNGHVTPSSVSCRHLSSSTPTPPTIPSDTKTESTESPEQQNDEVDKPKLRRTRVSATVPKVEEPLELPEDIDILWEPGTEQFSLDSPNALPPSEIFEEVLNNLLITLHPQTQHRATYATTSNPVVEPTLGLYCPIEGGEYVIDATVRELARRTGAEVLVVDSVQLAAGEWGLFGKAASSLQLPINPLHFPSPSPSSPASRTSSLPGEDEDEDGHFHLFPPPQQMTLTVMTPHNMQGRGLVAGRRSAPHSKIKVFFDSVVNLPSKVENPKGRPRLIYVRDFPTLAPTSSTWYPPLLSAVRQRRRGPLSRPTSAVSNPTTIIFGMTPSLTPQLARDIPGQSTGLMSLLMSRHSSAHVAHEPKLGKVDWGESEMAEKAREKRLRERLAKWEKHDNAFDDEFPMLSTALDTEGDSPKKPEIIVIGGPNGLSGMPPMIGPGQGISNSRSVDTGNKSSFFRASILVPRARSVVQERAARLARRREINELTTRMGVGSVGGRIEEKGAFSSIDLRHSEEQVPGVVTSMNPNNHELMWEEWGNEVMVWSHVRQISDRAVGSVMAVQANIEEVEKTTLDSTLIPWSAICDAWAAHRSTKEIRKNWMKEISQLNKIVQDEANEVDKEEAVVDEVVESVKNEADLDPHEHRLLPCIVDPVSMPTSFNQVHLPPHTIDSVRTIVSLPLLYPQAFQKGILKEHGMSGCLLFGPPGTGKTLVVRALAKEAGCRMIAVSPSDVMDMYVGEGEKLVRAVFSLARRLSPCVVFLDEIDALFGARMSARESGGAIAHRGVITEFMQEMDGLKTSREDSVIVIGATNRPFDLDDAVLRRMPRRLLVDLPGEKEREEILKILLRDEVLAGDVDIKELAKKTESFSGSDLKHFCVSAALDAVKERVNLPWNSTKPVPDLSSLNNSEQKANDPSASTSAAIVPEISDNSSSLQTNSSSKPFVSSVEQPPRILTPRNFTKALKEIVPSSSEMLGSLSELRKWNEEFGEGRRDRKRQQVWGRGRFGFINKPLEDRKTANVLTTTSLNGGPALE